MLKMRNKNTEIILKMLCRMGFEKWRAIRASVGGVLA